MDGCGFGRRRDRVVSLDHSNLFFVGHNYDARGGLYNIAIDAPRAAREVGRELREGDRRGDGGSEKIRHEATKTNEDARRGRGNYCLLATGRAARSRGPYRERSPEIESTSEVHSALNLRTALSIRLAGPSGRRRNRCT